MKLKGTFPQVVDVSADLRAKLRAKFPALFHWSIRWQVAPVGPWSPRHSFLWPPIFDLQL